MSKVILCRLMGEESTRRIFVPVLTLRPPSAAVWNIEWTNATLHCGWKRWEEQKELLSIHSSKLSHWPPRGKRESGGHSRTKRIICPLVTISRLSLTSQLSTNRPAGVQSCPVQSVSNSTTTLCSYIKNAVEVKNRYLLHKTFSLSSTGHDPPPTSSRGIRKTICTSLPQQSASQQ